MPGAWSPCPFSRKDSVNFLTIATTRCELAANGLDPEAISWLSLVCQACPPSWSWGPKMEEGQPYGARYRSDRRFNTMSRLLWLSFPSALCIHESSERAATLKDALHHLMQAGSYHAKTAPCKLWTCKVRGFVSLSAYEFSVYPQQR